MKIFMVRDEGSQLLREQMGIYSNSEPGYLTLSVLGLKIAQRLLECEAPLPSENNGVTPSENERIRIILACRSRPKAEAAVSELRRYFPQRHLLLDIEQVDLCNMKSVDDFCKRLLNRFLASFPCSL